MGAKEINPSIVFELFDLLPILPLTMGLWPPMPHNNRVVNLESSFVLVSFISAFLEV